MKGGTLADIIQAYRLNADVVAWDEFHLESGVNYIVNSDPSDRSGRHWMCVYNCGQLEFFDPLGYGPEQYLLDQKLPSTILCNNTPVQGPRSELCGEICIFYLYFRCLDYTMDTIVKQLDNAFMSNDEIVYRFVNKLLKI